VRRLGLTPPKTRSWKEPSQDRNRVEGQYEALDGIRRGVPELMNIQKEGTLDGALFDRFSQHPRSSSVSEAFLNRGVHITSCTQRHGRVYGGKGIFFRTNKDMRQNLMAIQQREGGAGYVRLRGSKTPNQVATKRGPPGAEGKNQFAAATVFM